MRSISKKIAFPPLAGSAIGVIGDNLSRQAIQIEGGIPPCYLNKGKGAILEWYRKVLYAFLYHKIFKCTGLLLFILAHFICFAQEQDSSSVLFQGAINANNINIRSDSTVNSKIICIMNKGEPVEVIRESYEWYRVRLPKTAPSFVKKNLVALIDEKTAKVIKDNVNIRLKANESSPILGKTDKDEVINILGERGEWYKIEPLNNSFGWVHKKFVNPAPQEATAVKPWGGVNKADTINKKEEAKLAQKTEKENKIADEKASQEENATVEGVIKPYGKVIKRAATHKLIATDDKVFLLKGNKGSLDSLNHHKVRVTGKILQSKKQRYAIIEIQKIEALD